MSNIDLDELDRLYRKATGERWQLVKVSSSATPENFTCYIEYEKYHSVDFDLEHNAACVVAIHNAYPALSARLRELESKDAERGGCEQCKAH